MRAIAEELRKYDADLYAKPRWLVLNKLDMVNDPQDVQQRLCKELQWDAPVFAISALSGDGTQALIWALQDYLDAEKGREMAEQDKEADAYVPEDPRFDESRRNLGDTDQ